MSGKTPKAMEQDVIKLLARIVHQDLAGLHLIPFKCSMLLKSKGTGLCTCEKRSSGQLSHPSLYSQQVGECICDIHKDLNLML